MIDILKERDFTPDTAYLDQDYVDGERKILDIMGRGRAPRIPTLSSPGSKSSRPLDVRIIDPEPGTRMASPTTTMLRRPWLRLRGEGGLAFSLDRIAGYIFFLALWAFLSKQRAQRGDAPLARRRSGTRWSRSSPTTSCGPTSATR